MLFRAIGKEPNYSRLPVWIFDVSIDVLQWLADIFKSEPLENAAELGRIGKYYAVEDMVENDNRYGTITLQEYFNRIATEGQEYDPYTSMTGILGMLGNDGSDDDNEVYAAGIKQIPVPVPTLALAKNDTLSTVSSSAKAVEGAY
jgi:hypothetical protein